MFSLGVKEKVVNYPEANPIEGTDNTGKFYIRGFVDLDQPNAQVGNTMVITRGRKGSSGKLTAEFSGVTGFKAGDFIEIELQYGSDLGQLLTSVKRANGMNEVGYQLPITSDNPTAAQLATLLVSTINNDGTMMFKAKQGTEKTKIEFDASSTAAGKITLKNVADADVVVNWNTDLATTIGAIKTAIGAASGSLYTVSGSGREIILTAKSTDKALKDVVLMVENKTTSFSITTEPQGGIVIEPGAYWDDNTVKNTIKFGGIRWESAAYDLASTTYKTLTIKAIDIVPPVLMFGTAEDIEANVRTDYNALGLADLGSEDRAMRNAMYTSIHFTSTAVEHSAVSTQMAGHGPLNSRSKFTIYLRESTENQAYFDSLVAKFFKSGSKFLLCDKDESEHSYSTVAGIKAAVQF